MAPARRRTRERDVERAERIDEIEAKGPPELDNAIGADRDASDVPEDRVWTLYNEKAEKYDRMLATRLKGSMDSVVIFAGLFSAVVTAFIIESYKTLSPDSDDVAIIYLAQISQQLAGSGNVTLPLDPLTSFVAPRTSVAVNILWILSLIFALACALGSTLIQNWTNRYLRKISRSPDKIQRARDRARFYNGIRKSQMRNLADGVPALLHIALFLFLAGLVVFLFPINHDVAWAAMAAAITFAVIYLLLAGLHLTVPSWPYHTPLSWAIVVFCMFVTGPILSAIGFSVSVTIGSLFIAAAILCLLAFPVYKLAQYAFGVSIDIDWETLRNGPIMPPPPETLTALETIKRVEPDIEDTKQDKMILEFLFSQTNSVAEAEYVLAGIEAFVDRDKDLGAQFVLQLGNQDVGTFQETYVGEFVGMLLHSCSDSTNIPLERRRARLMTCARAMVSVFAHSTSQDRTANTFYPMTGILSWVPRHDAFAPVSIPRWQLWFTRATYHGLISLRADKDPILSFSSMCLSALLVHCTLADIAHRIGLGEVVVKIPTSWNVYDLLRASNGVRKDQLLELRIAVLLMRGIDDKTSGGPDSDISVLYGVPPGRWSWRVRPITATFPPDNVPAEGNGTRSQPQEEAHVLTQSKLVNEATLLTLTIVLNHVSKSTLPSVKAHSDLLRRTLQGLLKDGSGAYTDGKMQCEFLNLLQDIYGQSPLEPAQNDFIQHHVPQGQDQPQGNGTSTDVQERRNGLEAEEGKVDISCTLPSRVPRPSHDDEVAPLTEPIARSLLFAPEIVDLIIPVVETLDNPECADAMKKVLRRLRGPQNTMHMEVDGQQNDKVEAGLLEENQAEVVELEHS